MINLIGKKIENENEFQSCIANNHFVEVWVGEEFDDLCLLNSFNDETVKTNEGFYYLRSNITLIACTNNDL